VIRRRELSIERVQRWVITFLILAVSSFPLGALVAVIHRLVEEDRRSDASILLVVMALLGILALGAIRLVHRCSPATAWILLGALPAVIAGVLIL